MTSLRHGNLVESYGIIREDPVAAGQEKPAPKLAQEYCPDGTLLEQLQKRKYSAEQAFKWLRQTASGMAYLHSAEVIHRDLKPENVLLKGDTAKVTDIGLFSLRFSGQLSDKLGWNLTSRTSPSFFNVVDIAASARTLVSEEDSHAPALSNGDLGATTTEKKSGAFVKEVSSMTGTLRYMAPECHEASAGAIPITGKADVFAFAILAYEMLTRTRAYSDDERFTMEQIAKAVHEGRRPHLPKSWALELCALVEKMWAHDPAERPSFREVEHELGQLIEKASGADGGVAGMYGVRDVSRNSCGCAFM